MRSRTRSSTPCSTASATGRIELGPGGVGVARRERRAPGIEAPYLQLVMQRLWDVERARGSTTLRPATLAGLGGAGQIVADHLERAIDALTPEQREIAARLFDHLVTPSGTKIAHEASDLAEFARGRRPRCGPVVGDLAEPPHPADGRGGTLGDLPRRPRGRRARLEEPSRRRAGRRARARRGAAATPPARVARLRCARRARGR